MGLINVYLNDNFNGFPVKVTIVKVVGIVIHPHET